MASSVLISYLLFLLAERDREIVRKRDRESESKKERSVAGCQVWNMILRPI